jgi:hypothetical protein
MIALPSVHLNGTSRDSLVEQAAEAARALDSALDAMCAAAPNARDYYVQAPGAFERACGEHEQRVAAVQAVKTLYELTACAIDEEARRGP